MQERVPEESQREPARGHQRPRDTLAFQYVGLEGVEGHQMKIGMRVGMIAELETAIKPAAQQIDPLRIDRAIGGVQLVLVDETDRRHMMRRDARQQLAGQLAARLDVTRQDTGDRQIVERDRYLATGSCLPRRSCPDVERSEGGREREQDQRQAKRANDAGHETCLRHLTCLPHLPCPSHPTDLPHPLHPTDLPHLPSDL